MEVFQRWDERLCFRFIRGLPCYDLKDENCSGFCATRIWLVKVDGYPILLENTSDHALCFITASQDVLEAMGEARSGLIQKTIGLIRFGWDLCKLDQHFGNQLTGLSVLRVD